MKHSAKLASTDYSIFYTFKAICNRKTAQELRGFGRRYSEQQLCLSWEIRGQIHPSLKLLEVVQLPKQSWENNLIHFHAVVC